MEINSHLHFNGDCATAFRFYERILGGRIEMMMTNGESPVRDQVPAEWCDKVIHARLSVGGQLLLGCDAPGERYARPQGFQVSITVQDAAEARRVFDALAEGGAVTMPFDRTFWSPGFGMTIDRFGVPWMVNTASDVVPA